MYSDLPKKLVAEALEHFLRCNIEHTLVNNLILFLCMYAGTRVAVQSLQKAWWCCNYSTAQDGLTVEQF